MLTYESGLTFYTTVFIRAMFAYYRGIALRAFSFILGMAARRRCGFFHLTYLVAAVCFQTCFMHPRVIVLPNTFETGPPE